ncbi:MAG: DUF6492 family protein [Actinomycetota bacterium]|nr:DUF6492 family protein [Actinomycetota bacterium]
MGSIGSGPGHEVAASRPERDLAIFVKTYAPDRALVARLLASAERFNRDAVPIVVAVPDEERSSFARIGERPGVRIVAESQLGAPVVTAKVREFDVGYIQQQVVKLCVHRLGLARNYFVLDSDSFFIRPFSVSDFLDGEGRPFTVLVQDKDLATLPGYAGFATIRDPLVTVIADYLGLPAQPRSTSHNNTVLSSAVLSSFESWREARGLSLVDLMEIAPLEYSWYNFYLQRHHPELVVPVEPLVRMIHTRAEFRSLVRQGVTVETLARSYIGVCINSGWAGRGQARVLATLERGSSLARVRARVDARRYGIRQQVEFFRGAHGTRLRRPR